jgi:DNA replication and repair protein RecF
VNVSRLRVQNFRNHDDISCEFSPTISLIYGPNGAGKTSLLEALYIAYRGTSFKGFDRDIVNESRSWYRIDVRDEQYARTVLFDDRTGKRLKQFTVDDKKSTRLLKRTKRPVVLFSPDDLRLFTGSPARRRQYIDKLIIQFDEAYGQALRRYERALLQRNKLLKSPYVSPDVLFSWNVILSENGATILTARARVIDYLRPYIQKYYTDIAKNTDGVSIEYPHAVYTSQQLLQALEQSYERDKLLGSTSVGPHRHDIAVKLRGRHAADIASRGENRTLVLALKYAEGDMLHDMVGELPLIMLDDVFGELDVNHRKSLMKTFSGYQIIITSTDDVSAGLSKETKKIRLA